MVLNVVLVIVTPAILVWQRTGSDLYIVCSVWLLKGKEKKMASLTKRRVDMKKKGV